MPETGSTKVTVIGSKPCKPFLLDVMVFSPEAGFKFKVTVERSCTPEAEALWKLVFDLFKVDEDEKELQIVHVSFTTGTPVQRKAVQRMATQGVTPEQATILVEEVHPAAKDLEGAGVPTTEQKQRLRDALNKVVNVEL